MARGWESKSVEMQREGLETTASPQRTLSAADREKAQRQEGLRLDRARVSRELEQTGSPLRRAALEHALRHLDGEIAKLDS